MKYKTIKPKKSSLGALPTGISQMIGENQNQINNILNRANKLNGLGRLQKKASNMLTAAEVINRYNSGISDEEIQAWVWYRRSIGIPMNGWEKFFIDSNSSKGLQEKMMFTKESTMIKDNHFRDLKVVPKGTLLGKRIGNKTHEYAGVVYIFYRDSEGIKIVNRQHIKESRSDMKTDSKKLDALLRAGALFYLDGDLLPYPVYAYGNMYDRELDLRNDKDYIIKKFGEKIYEAHLKVIVDNRPKMLSIMNPDVGERQQILSISQYAANFYIEGLREETGVNIKEKSSLFTAFKSYLRSLDKGDFENVSAYEIIRYYLNGDNLPRDLDKALKTELRSNVRNEGEELFKKFLYEALLFEDQQKLDFDWNRKYNGQSSVAHHKIPIGFKMSSKFKGFDLEIRPPQREGIAFMELVGSGIVAYDVGVGKTITAIIELANALNSGKCSRPLIVVPNPTYKNWISEIIGNGEGNEGVLTGTGVTLNEWYNLGSKIIPKINLNKAVPEKSITLVTYEGMKKIGFGEQVGEELFTELVNILSQSDISDKSQRDIEKDYQKYWEKIGVGLKGTVADIDKLGFDYIVIDEAHRIKNVFNGVRKDHNGKKRFGTQGGQSDLGIKGFFINNYLQRKYGRNVMLLTATPFTNSPLEVYSMLSHVAYQGLREMGYYNIQSFFEQFVQETTVDAVNYKEEIVQKDVVKSFNNRLILQKLIYNHINYKTGEEAGVKRPCKINLPRVSQRLEDGSIKKLAPKDQILTYLKMSDRQRSNQDSITRFAHSASKKRGGGDILKAMNFSLNNALSPFLYDHEEVIDYNHFVIESPKIHYACEAIRTVKEYHEKRGEEISGQVIYMNRGTSYFHYIKQYLEEEVGFKKAQKFGKYKIDEVEILDGSTSQTKREKIKEAFNGGACKVIIGTATIREGINLQKKSTAIFNLYPDWNPTDLRQLEGRIWRYGNSFGYVRIVMPLVQDSMDVFVFQKIEEKTSRINDIWYKGDRGNVLDLESLDPEEVKYALLTDIDAIAQTILNKEIKKQKRLIEGVEYTISLLRTFTQNASYLDTYRKRVNDAITAKMNEFRDFDYIQSTPSAAQLKKYDKDKRKLIEKDIKLYNDILELQKEVPITDKSIIKIARMLKRRFEYFNSFYTDYFMEYMVKVKKAEKTILNPKGFTVDDDIDAVIGEYKKDLEKANKDLAFIMSKEHKSSISNEVKKKKSAMRIGGKSIIDRVNEFKSLNHLLSYKFSATNIESCPLPVKEASGARLIKPKKMKSNESEALALAMALQLQLELLQL